MPSVNVCNSKWEMLSKVLQQHSHLFANEYLRSPTASDMAAINQLHRRVHSVDGMIGSLDCMHTYWNNCPVAWQQSYKGKEAAIIGSNLGILWRIGTHNENRNGFP
jgi:Plant transposon protein